MNEQERKNILEFYTHPENLSQLPTNEKGVFQLTEQQKSELIQALGDKFANKPLMLDKKTLPTLCNMVLKNLGTVLAIKAPENYEQTKRDFIQQQKDNIQKGREMGELWDAKEFLQHTQENKLNYRSGSFEEKLKATRGYGHNFRARSQNPEEIKKINQKYMTLNPEELEKIPELLDLMLNGKKQKGYPLPEIQILVDQVMKNPEQFKQKLFNYETLVLPKEGGYSEEETERILGYNIGKDERGYIITENTPYRHEEKHLQKYRGNKIRISVFENKGLAHAYLYHQLQSMDQQLPRFEEMKNQIFYFKRDIIKPGSRDIYIDDKEMKEIIEITTNEFSKHGTYTDQFIVEKLKLLLSNKNPRNRELILKTINTQIEKGKEESYKKQKLMQEQLVAFINNRLF